MWFWIAVVFSLFVRFFFPPNWEHFPYWFELRFIPCSGILFVVFLHPLFPFPCGSQSVGAKVGLGFLPEGEDISSSNDSDSDSDGSRPVLSPLLFYSRGLFSHTNSPASLDPTHGLSSSHCSPGKHKLLHIHPLRLQTLEHRRPV